jgi:DNA-binding transcriptional MocR family regulator
MKNFSQIPNAMIRDPQISDGAFRTLLVLITFRYRSNNVFPSQQTIAKHRGKSKKTIINHLKTLKLKGLIDYKKRGYSASNQYFFIGEEKYTIDNKDVEDNDTSKVKKTSSQKLQILQPNNNKINDIKHNNNVKNKEDWELGRRKVEEIRKKMNYIFKAKSIDNEAKK